MLTLICVFSITAHSTGIIKQTHVPAVYSADALLDDDKTLRVSLCHDAFNNKPDLAWIREE